MKASKILPPIFLSMLSVLCLCTVNTQPVKSQVSDFIFIADNGNIYSSTNATVPIQRVGDVYTFNDSIVGYSVVIYRDNILVNGSGHGLQGTGNIPGIDLSYRSNVTISNMQIGGFFCGVYLYNSLNSTITENNMANLMNGIIIQNASNNNIISANIFANCGSGISLSSSSGNIISANKVARCSNGISLSLSSNNILRDNTMNNTFNLAVYGTELSHFVNDIDISNTINGKKVYYLVEQSNTVINPSTFPELGFLALVNCANMSVQNLELANNGQGIVLAFTTGSKIESNSVTNNYNGVALYSSSSNAISRNTITNNYRGIQLSKSSTGNHISENKIANNNDGIYLFESSQNNIDGNNVTNNEIGMGFSTSSYNMIYHNYFVSNKKQVYDSHMDDTSITLSVNYWDFNYPLGGNYWSDYTGVDAKSGANQDQPGSDGIGDTPYIIYENNKDNYPLMPYGSRPAISIISPENKTYTMNYVSLTFIVSKPTSWIGYSLDGKANVTITGNTTVSGLPYGLHSIIVYANDPDGKTGASETVYFTIAQETEPQQEPIPITWIVASVAIVTVGFAAILVYFKKIKKPTGKVKK